MPLMIECDYCHKKYKSFPSRKSKTHYCCKLHMNLAHHHYRVCRNCRRKFRVNMTDVEHGEAIYCSKKCVAQSQSRKRQITCRVCGKQVMRKASQINLYAYCSKECFLKGVVNKVLITCRVCGKQKLRKAKDVCNNTYCSKECWLKFNREKRVTVTCPCGKQVSRTPSQVFKNNYCCKAHQNMYQLHTRKDGRWITNQSSPQATLLKATGSLIS